MDDETRERSADRKARLDAEIERRRARGEPFLPLQVTNSRGAVAGTFWGGAWCGHMEGLSDFRDRLPPAKRALRGGQVYDLTISPGEVFAYVVGPEIFEVLVRIEPVGDEAWERLLKRCGGEVASLGDLLRGRLGDGAMRALSDPEAGLFPQLDEVRVQCDCPDYADLCPHGAATLYAVGVKLDAEPELLFTLRGRDPGELIAGATLRAVRGPDEASREADRPSLVPEELGALFGLDLADPEAAFGEDPA